MVVHACPHPARVLRTGVALVLGVTLASGLVLLLCGVDLLRHLSFFPACPFHTASGLPCPGCGMTRAFLLLGQLRIGEALAAHPLAPGLLLAVLWTLAGTPGRARIPRDAVATALLALVVGVWLARLLLAAP
jgi:hypothetical protein